MTLRGGMLFAAVLLALAGPAPGVQAEGLSDALNPFGAYYNNVARAAEKNDVSQVRSLLASGNNPNQAEGDSLQTGLQWAAINGNIQITAILVKAGARLNDRDKLGNTALHYAAIHGQVEIAKLLLDVGAGIDEQNHDGTTPLMFAAQKGEVEMVRTLLARGANPNKSDYTGRDALSWGMDSHRPALVELLKQAAVKKR
jgi:ankyrin repeat protein